jgi:uncharacterized MAPEG superfamily protein
VIVELQVLGLAALLWVIQLSITSVVANLQIGPSYMLSPRDEGRQLAGRPARLKRALDNHLEGLVIFTVAVVLVALGDAANAATALCAWIYLAARIVYVPAYAFGWTPWRSLIWTVGFLATLVMLLIGLLG